MASLVGKNAEVEGKIFPVVDEHTYIGRHEDNDISLQDVSVSHQHCILFKLEDGLVAQDQDSTNGVSVNGEMIDEADLFHGDELAVGDILFTVDAPEFPAQHAEEEKVGHKAPSESPDLTPAPPPAPPAPVKAPEAKGVQDIAVEPAQEPPPKAPTQEAAQEPPPVEQSPPPPAKSLAVPGAAYSVSYVIGMIIFILLVVLYVTKIMGS